MGRSRRCTVRLQEEGGAAGRRRILRGDRQPVCNRELACAAPVPRVQCSGSRLGERACCSEGCCGRLANALQTHEPSPPPGLRADLRGHETGANPHGKTIAAQAGRIGGTPQRRSLFASTSNDSSCVRIGVPSRVVTSTRIEIPAGPEERVAPRRTGSREARVAFPWVAASLGYTALAIALTWPWARDFWSGRVEGDAAQFVWDAWWVKSGCSPSRTRGGRATSTPPRARTSPHTRSRRS